jgi:hypothetical protein
MEHIVKTSVEKATLIPLTHVSHSWVENCLEVRLMEDHLTKTHLEDGRLIYLLDFMDGRYLIQKCSCHHGTHRL